MKINNKKGFVLIETIIVMSILAIGLLSLYGSFAIIVSNNQKSNVSNAINTYIAYQINDYLNKNNKDKPTGEIPSTYFIEISSLNNSFYRKDCGIISNEIRCTSPTNTSISEDEMAIYNNLNIDKIYYFLVPINELYAKNLLILFDGSTINYIDKIKNDANISLDAEKTIIIKTKESNNIEFSYYQQQTIIDKYNIKKMILGNNNVNVQATNTKPGVDKSTENEYVLSATMDDYGVSYYYRGNVQNNYLVFAYKCWRIVRITGTGDIRLVLYNGESSNCNVNNNDSAFAKYSGSNYISKFNEAANSNTYIGYMYSNNTTSDDYNTNHNNVTTSTILSNLRLWYDIDDNGNKTFTEEEKALIVDSIWCNDKRVVTGSGVKNVATTYAASQRLAPVNNASPSLICGSSNTISKFNSLGGLGNGTLGVYKVGLLTADEVAFAGGSADNNSANNSCYLRDNATSNAYWTMSPAHFNNSAYMWVVNGSGNLVPAAVNSTNIAIRPAITITSTINVTGSGTKTDPYMIIY